ncbi:hypothetical protein B0H10DRAFT_2236797 [Mycena sp. CBHHK59/15]|nr:hypothetical protein B0H10DRAFT_2236797 [Mycena sp. CBHHK59/15]
MACDTRGVGRARRVALSLQHKAAPGGRINGLHLDERVPDPVAAVNAAREAGLPWEVVHAPGACAVRWSEISATDLRVLALGKERQHRFLRELVRLEDVVFPHGACGAARTLLVVAVMDLGIRGRDHLAALRWGLQWVLGTGEKKFCPQYALRVAQLLTLFRVRYW